MFDGLGTYNRSIMERIQAINTERINWCCADQGITLDQLAAETGVAKASLDRLMQGESGLTFNQLHKVASHFGRGVLFFLEAAPVNEAQAHSPQFRTLANQKPEISFKLKALIERVEKQREVYISLREDLDNTDRPAFNPPVLPEQNPQEAARIARQWLGLSESNEFDTYREALEAKGILVFRSNGYTGKWQIAKENPILGFTLYDATCPVIVIKKQAWDTQQSFTLMHELGHLLMHRQSSIDDERDMYSYQGMEREANAFAGNLLVPNHFLATIRDNDRPAEAYLYDSWLERQKRAWGISPEVILRRLMDSGRLGQDQYDAYRAWRRQTVPPESAGGSRAFRNREPKHVFGDVFVRTVFESLNAKNITLNKASSYLDSLKIKDLRKLEAYYAGL